MTAPAAGPSKLDQFLGIVGNAITLLAGPILGADAEKVVTLVQFGTKLLLQGEGGAADLTALNQQVQLLVDEHRAPTPEEWATWEARLAAVDARFKKIEDSF